MTSKREIVFILALTLAVLSACRGNNDSASSAGPTTATIKLATAGSLSGGTLIGGIDITGTLPEHVTLKATTDSVNPQFKMTDSGVVTASGAAASGTSAVAAVYTAATSTLPGTVRIMLVNAPGLTTGEFCTVTGTVDAGYTVSAADAINPSNFTVKDQNGEVISGLTVTFTAQM